MATTVTRVCVVRHGETEWNVARRIQGHTDVALSAVGQQQALATAEALSAAPVAAVFSSDLARAAQTATAIADARGGIAVSVSPVWRERAYGVFEGLTYAEAKAVYGDAYAAFEARDPAQALPGGESLADLAARVVPAFDALAAAWSGATVVVVTHGGVLDVLNRHVRRRDLATPRDFSIPNAGLNWFAHDRRGWTLTSWGDQRHLEQALDELR